MARTDYIQPDPIRGFDSNQQRIVRGDANSTRQRMKVNPGVGYRQQAANLGNKALDASINTGANAGKAILGGVDATRDFFSQGSNGMRLNNQPGANTQNDLASLGNNIQGAGNGVLNGLESFGRAIASPFEQGGMVNNAGRDLGGYIYDATHDQNPQEKQIAEQSLGLKANQPGVNNGAVTVGSPESRSAHQKILDQYNINNTPASTDAPGKYQTNNYRDATITTGNKADSEGDTLGVSLGDTGSVSGLTPEQASRIQNSLALGNQVVSPNQPNIDFGGSSQNDGTLFGRPVEQQQQNTGMGDSARQQVMQAMRDGSISADKASALLNKDYRASDRMDRLGGKADSYIKPDAQPTNAKEAMAYAQNLNNFTRNGELNEKQALVAQQSYLQSLGGIYGVANSGQKQSDSKVVMQKQYDQHGTVIGESPYAFNPSDNSYEELGGNKKKQSTRQELIEAYNDPKASEKLKGLSVDLFKKIYGETMQEFVVNSAENK